MFSGSSRSRRITVCTSTSAPAQSSSSPEQGTVSPAMHDRRGTIVNPVPEGRPHRRVVGRCGRNTHGPFDEQLTPLALGDLGRGCPGEVVVVRHAVADVGFEHGFGRPDEVGGAGRSEDGERAGLERHDPARRDDVVEVGDVVAVQVGEEQCPQGARTGADRSGADQDGAPAVEEKVTGGRANQGGRTGPLGVGERDTTAQDDRLHVSYVLPDVGHESLGRSRSAHPSRRTRRASSVF